MMILNIFRINNLAKKNPNQWIKIYSINEKGFFISFLTISLISLLYVIMVIAGSTMLYFKPNQNHGSGDTFYMAIAALSLFIGSGFFYFFYRYFGHQRKSLENWLSTHNEKDTPSANES